MAGFLLANGLFTGAESTAADLVLWVEHHHRRLRRYLDLPEAAPDDARCEGVQNRQRSCTQLPGRGKGVLATAPALPAA